MMRSPEISGSADILLLCGGLTDYGLPEEADELVADIRAAVRIPVLAVLGNHDFESSQPEAISKVLDDAGVNVLNGEAIEIAGVGFAGIIGFGGGFGRRMLNAWGEPLINSYKGRHWNFVTSNFFNKSAWRSRWRRVVFRRNRRNHR